MCEAERGRRIRRTRKRDASASDDCSLHHKQTIMRGLPSFVWILLTEYHARDER